MGLLRTIHRLHAVRAGLAGMAGFEVRGEDVPRCPHCGWQLVPWVRDDTFLQGAAWREDLGRYERFVRERGGGRVLLLELGVGEMTPGIITLPFWSMAAKLPNAHLLSVNISGGTTPVKAWRRYSQVWRSEAY